MWHLLSLLTVVLFQPCQAGEFSAEDLEDLVHYLWASMKEKASEGKFKEGLGESLKEGSGVCLIAESSQDESEEDPFGFELLEESSNMHPDKRLSDAASTAGNTGS